MNISSPSYSIVLYSLIEPGGAWHSLLELKTSCWSLIDSNTVQPGAPKSGLVLSGGRTDKGIGVLCYVRMDQAGQAGQGWTRCSIL